MKKILIALILVMALLVVSACEGNTAADEPVVSSADTSATDLSNTDASASDALAAPEGYTGYMLGELYFCCPEDYTAVTATDAISITADSSTGANFSVSVTTVDEIDVAVLSKTDLDTIGENGAANLEAILGTGVDAEYTYSSHGTAFDGKGVYFAFDLAVNYTDLELSQSFSYYQLYIAEGEDVYVVTFATNTSFGDSNASVYFTDVLESLELRTAE